MFHSRTWHFQATQPKRLLRSCSIFNQFYKFQQYIEMSMNIPEWSDLSFNTCREIPFFYIVQCTTNKHERSAFTTFQYSKRVLYTLHYTFPHTAMITWLNTTSFKIFNWKKKLLWYFEKKIISKMFWWVFFDDFQKCLTIYILIW